MSPWRIVVLIYILCIQQVWVLHDYITGYVGQSVVLKSGAEQSWILTTVEWSIYKNTTYIASLKDGKVFTDRFWTHKGRLELNSKTGDLTIKNLKMDDSLKYTVALASSVGAWKESSVNLTVQERLKKPNIQQILNTFKDGHCHIVLRCDPYDKNVNLTWTPLDEIDGSYISGSPNFTESILWMSFHGNRKVTFNCTATNGQQNEADQITVGCTEEILMIKVCRSCSPMVVLGIFCTSVFFVILGAVMSKEKIKAACVDGPLHLFQSIFTC